MSVSHKQSPGRFSLLLLLLTCLSTCLFTTATSVDRITMGVSFNYISQAYVQTSSFTYDYLIRLANVSTTYVPEHLPTWLDVSNNKTVMGLISHSVGLHCTSGLRSLMLILADNQADAHAQVLRLVQQVHSSLPHDLLMVKTTRSSRAWISAVGKLFKVVFGTATTDDMENLSKRIATLETYVGSESHQSRLELNRLLAEEKLTSKRIDTMINDLKERNIILIRQFQYGLRDVAVDIEWTNIYIS